MITRDFTRHGTQRSGATIRRRIIAGLCSVVYALHRAAGLLDPWPGYAMTADELLEMLTAERRETETSSARRMGLDELLERHRRILARPMRSALSGEWIS